MNNAVVRNELNTLEAKVSSNYATKGDLQGIKNEFNKYTPSSVLNKMKEKLDTLYDHVNNSVYSKSDIDQMNNYNLGNLNFIKIYHRKD